MIRVKKNCNSNERWTLEVEKKGKSHVEWRMTLKQMKKTCLSDFPLGILIRGYCWLFFWLEALQKFCEIWKASDILKENWSLELLPSTFWSNPLNLKLHWQCLGQRIRYKPHRLERLIKEKEITLDTKWILPPPKKNVINSEVW